MINVHVAREQSGWITSFTMDGHANAGPHGEDLVCAGASAVAFGAVNAVYELADTALNVEQGEDGGYLSCTVPEQLARSNREQVQLLIEGMLVSLQTIAASYNEFITIHDVKGGEEP
ncbi:hypothetical protein B0H94_10913 [Salsuginibacillus halophilus]|uniref:Ribosomal processing cysteine protease Prp n=1 Tax=Salsuginibacillus halophilus TaxID=517424 RepID=A0A2P8HCM0_9BACI|nr:ribosomal-processing cysteine protease Prp [Salsuginibacillus halophilus]PSL43958.1 hypothetical protein B0H94_10913 [Salsuginibacillus halophilus]